MKPCVLFNPLARGKRAAVFRHRLQNLCQELEFRETASPEDARRKAQAAVEQGYTTIVAVGGDGTFNEVLNGVGAVPQAFESVRLGLLPLGTANVFAKELALPLKVEPALDVVRRGKERQIDLAAAEYEEGGRRIRRYFGQLGGAGLDARAIELVDWRTKQRVGAWAYVKAGFQALAERQLTITVSNGSETLRGELALIGNGRYYGGKLAVFGDAKLTDGFLHAVVFERVDWARLPRLGWGVISGSLTRRKGVRQLRGRRLELRSGQSAPFQLEGELVGRLPCVCEVLPRGLRMIVP